MTAAGQSTSRKRFPIWFERWLDQYGELQGFEKTGRIYELLGIRPVYVAFARIFGDPCLPTSRTIRSTNGQAFETLASQWTQEQIRTLRDRSNYFEVINLCIALSYVPLALMLAPLQSALAIYAVVLVVAHGWIVPLERYKRALSILMLAHTDPPLRTELPEPGRTGADKFRPHGNEQRPDDLNKIPATSVNTPVMVERHWLYGPWLWETEQLYRAIGVEDFRAFVLEVSRVTTPKELRHIRPRSIASLDPEDVEAFEQRTRLAQISHIFGLGLHLPFLMGLLYERYLPGILYMVLLVGLDTYALLLQRATRARLHRVLERRSMQSCSPPGRFQERSCSERR